MRNKTIVLMLMMALAILPVMSVPAETAPDPVPDEPEKIPVRALILPKFEVEEMTGDFPGEAQYYYESYLDGAEAYDIPGVTGGSRLYVKDGAALFILGMGKVQAGLNTMAVLQDPRFDFSEALILSTGCAGSAYEYGVMGDVFIITAAVDFDLGHHADSRDLADESALTWFHDPDFDDIAVVKLDPELTESVYELVKDVPLETTERTRRYMEAAFDGAQWAVRDPKVQKGTTVTADNYWKGMHDHDNAVLMTETYGCPDPYALTEMEDVAVATAVKHMGLLDHFLIIRDSVNMDVFMQGATPESLWDPEFEEEMSLASEDSIEAADIFETAMKNNFAVGKVVIDAALQGRLF